MAKDDQLPPKKAKKGAAEPKKSREGEKKPKWTPEEDDALKNLVDELGSRGAWPQIAQRLGTGRSPAAVEQHWRGGGGEAPKKPIKEKKKAGTADAKDDADWDAARDAFKVIADVVKDHELAACREAAKNQPEAAPLALLRSGGQFYARHGRWAGAAALRRRLVVASPRRRRPSRAPCAHQW